MMHFELYMYTYTLFEWDKNIFNDSRVCEKVAFTLWTEQPSLSWYVGMIMHDTFWIIL